jgi:hypothetical protein
VNGGADAEVCAAPADVAAHGCVNLGVGGRRRRGEEGCRLHDLATLAVAALWDIVGAPGALHGVRAGRAQSLDRGDAFPLYCGERRLATSNRATVQVYCAGTARADAASELGPREPELVAEIKEQRRGCVSHEAMADAVDPNLHMLTIEHLTVRGEPMRGSWRIPGFSPTKRLARAKSFMNHHFRMGRPAASLVMPCAHLTIGVRP